MRATMAAVPRVLKENIRKCLSLIPRILMGFIKRIKDFCRYMFPAITTKEVGNDADDEEAAQVDDGLGKVCGELAASL